MYFYHHYIQKGFKHDFLESLDFYTRMFYMASMNIELEEKNKTINEKAQALKSGAFPVVTF